MEQSKHRGRIAEQQEERKQELALQRDSQESLAKEIWTMSGLFCGCPFVEKILETAVGESALAPSL